MHAHSHLRIVQCACIINSKPELDSTCAFSQDEEKSKVSSSYAVSAAGECDRLVAEKEGITRITSGNQNNNKRH